MASPVTDLRSLFNSFAAFGRGSSTGLEGRTFAKMCKDAGLFSKKYTSTDADLIFAKVKAKGAKTISFEQFEAALELVAERKGLAVTELTAQLLKAGGPVSHGTTAEAVRFFDDKATWGSGIHAHGGPSTADGAKNLSQVCDRSTANVRGVGKTFAKPH